MPRCSPCATSCHHHFRRRQRSRVAAGREVGRSFRDRMRSDPAPVETWQFDELSRPVASSRQVREFARGVLDGLLHGRAQDQDIPGFVWLAHSAFGLALRPVDAELSAFWHAVSEAAVHLVGEEFPAFVGDPAAAAHAEDAGRRALAAGGPVRRSLAARYQAGITPGLPARAWPRRQCRRTARART